MVIKKGIHPGDTVLICRKRSKLDGFEFSEKELGFIHTQMEGNNPLITINQYHRRVYIVVKDIVSEKKTGAKKNYEIYEALRRTGHKIGQSLNQFKIKVVMLVDVANDKNDLLRIAEGMALGNYQFLKYLKNSKEKANSLSEIYFNSKNITSAEIENLQILINATCIARDLVNEPVSYLTATQFSNEILTLGKEAGFRVEVLDKTKIEKLGMGGILGVNKGSIEPPTFNILEWKPKGAKNKKPIVLVGKGIVFDTGGLSLKPTLGSMDEMKSDMAGGAAVACTFYYLAKCKIPVHAIGLIPATDNRPGGDACAPGDIITQYGGTTVEVLNTDAEGRLVLADALEFAKNYNPELVIDIATLTGACVRAIGISPSGLMGTASEKTKAKLKNSGLNVFERLVELPFWDDYLDCMKSEIADLKNSSGTPYAGAITAGKFLEHFTKNEEGELVYPWLHIDISGPSFLTSNDSYRGKGGTGVGVRLLVNFLTN